MTCASLVGKELSLAIYYLAGEGEEWHEKKMEEMATIFMEWSAALPECLIFKQSLVSPHTDST